LAKAVTDPSTRVVSEVLEAFNLPFGVIATVDGEICCELGRGAEIKESSLFESLLGSPESIRNLESYIHDKVLPQSWAQGNLRAIILKDGLGRLVVLFDTTPRTPVDSHQLGKKILESLQASGSSR
jgi:hypothetical protein